MRGTHFFRSGAGLLLGLVIAMAPVAAAALSFSGTDAQSQFTSYSASPVQDTVGVFTFEDSLDGTNPTSTGGTVTAEDGISGLAGGVIDLQMLLDLSGGFDPTTGLVVDASFTGTGGNEIIIWDSSETTALLVFSISFVDVRNANGLNTSNNISMGDPEGSIERVNSELTLVGGTLAGAAGGIGHQATLDLQFDPIPELPGGFGAFAGGYAGFLDNSLSGSTNWSITMTPEPGTGSLLASALVYLGLRGRQRRRR